MREKDILLRVAIVVYCTAVVLRVLENRTPGPTMRLIILEYSEITVQEYSPTSLNGHVKTRTR
ncbi:hypothetical protein RR46_08114 [Papilio xuthus]|uniref:Uncharacterized protein n=1 Tax=Papilio xuthus TaxID=66420 RepID=A0A194Q9Z5_PAPXU|nr:hypothetical protein RR46_08114 [Papilio xuthus]